MRYDTHSSCLFRLTIASLLEERDLITQLACLFCLIILQNVLYYVHSLQKFRATLLKISSNLTSGDLTGYCLGSPCKVIHGSLGCWIPDSLSVENCILDSMSMEPGFRIPIISRILDSLSWIPDSKAQDSGFHNQILSK